MKAGKFFWMRYEEFRGLNGVTMVRITTPEGRTYEFQKLSTKPLGLESEDDPLDKSLRERFEAATRKTRRLGKPLHEIVPVS